jgi:hypothetical protein
MAVTIGSVDCDRAYGRPPTTDGGSFRLVVEKIDTSANVETWVGQLKALAVALESWTRPGVDGYGLRTLDSRTSSGITITLADATTYTQCVIGDPSTRNPVRVTEKKACEIGGSLYYVCRVELLGFRF